MEYLHWHLWQSNNQWLLSDESVKKLRQFPSMGHVVNFLMLNGHKEAARHFHKIYKQC